MYRSIMDLLEHKGGLIVIHYRLYIDWQSRYSWGHRTQLFEAASILKLMKEIEDWKAMKAEDEGFEVLNVGKMHVRFSDSDHVYLPRYINRSSRAEGGADADMIRPIYKRY